MSEHPSAIAAFFATAMEHGRHPALDVDDVLAEDGHAVIFWSGGAERPGKRLDAHGIMAST